MEALVFILIIVFAVVTGKKEQKKKEAGAQRTAGAGKPAPRQKPAPKRKPAAGSGSFVGALTELIEDLTESAPVAVDSRAASAPGSAKGHMLEGPRMLDEEGCVGGSMEHTHEEGESRAEHSRHMRAVLEREARDRAEAMAGAPRPAIGPSDIDAHALRRAVIMSEILNRPRALRRR